MTPLRLAVDSLAVYRLTRLIVRDELTRPARERWLEPALDRPGLPGRAAYLATCPWCSSVWIAAGLAAARRAAPGLTERAARVLAVAAAAGLILDRDRG